MRAYGVCVCVCGLWPNGDDATTRYLLSVYLRFLLAHPDRPQRLSDIIATLIPNVVDKNRDPTRCVRAWVRAFACVHACVRACVHACMRACVHACACMCVRACTYPRVCAASACAYAYVLHGSEHVCTSVGLAVAVAVGAVVCVLYCVSWMLSLLTALFAQEWDPRHRLCLVAVV